MQELLKLFVDIALLRRSPREVPTAQTFAFVIVGLYFAANAVQSWLLFGPAGAVTWALVDLGVTAAYYYLILAVGTRRHRYRQTLIAVLGVTLLLMPLSGALNWLLLAYKPLGLLFSVLLLSLLCWYVGIIAHIVRTALDSPLFTGVVVALAYLYVSYMAQRWVMGPGG
jgi:hypothetical protein